MEGSFEERIVTRCRDGDRGAYAGLVKAYSGRVVAICLGILGNSHDAEDVAQQAMLKGFTDIGKLRNGQRFGAWISRIASNMCIDFIRSQRRKHEALGRHAAERRPEPAEYSRLQAALQELPEDCRLPLMLYYFEGRSAADIAEALELSENAVHARMSRARKRLRELLSTEGGA